MQHPRAFRVHPEAATIWRRLRQARRPDPGTAAVRGIWQARDLRRI